MQPSCEAYISSSAWTLKEEEDGVIPGDSVKKYPRIRSTFTATLNGRKVAVSTWAVAFEHETRMDALVGYPAWPKGMGAPYVAFLDYGSPEAESNGFNITVDGDPIPNLVVGLYHNLPPPDSQWNASLEQGTWVPVTDTSGLFRADLIHDGTTLFLEGGPQTDCVPTYKMEKMSNYVVSYSTSPGVGGYPFGIWLSEGQQCK